MRLNNSVVLITGGAGGIGEALIKELLNCKAKVSVLDLREPQTKGADLLYTCGDVTTDATRRQFVDRTLAKFGRIDVLINNVGVGLYQPTMAASLDLTRRLMEVNVFSLLAMSQLVVPLLIANQSGAIVNIGSVGGEVALPWAGIYCASKYAVHCLSDSMRRELSKHNVRVILVKPGVVVTGFRQRVLGGAAPEGVGEINGLDPAIVARRIRQGLEGRAKVIWTPWYGWCFSLLDHLIPSFIDKYVEACWSTQSQTSSYFPDARTRQLRPKAK